MGRRMAIDQVRLPRRPLVVLVVVISLVLAMGGSAHGTEADEPLQVRRSVTSVGQVTPEVRITGSGWGHGVGMSQVGAYAQALAGRTADQILAFYYPGTQMTADPRSSSERIRVSILDEQTSTTIEATGGPVEWRRCRPDAAKGESVGGRLTDCADWFTQAAGTILVACPYRGPATVPQTGEPVPEHQRDGVRLLRPAVHAVDGCAGPAERTTNGYPVARAWHDGTVIRTPSHGGVVRPYRHGWRDLHSREQGTRLNSVQDIPSVELYLRGLDEVQSSWGRSGPAALRAQAITGRTFALGRLGIASACACDIRATPADQHYTGDTKASDTDGDLWVAAVESTRARVLTYDGRLAQTFYSASTGGRTENIEDSWAYGTEAIPYLRSVDDPWSLDPAVTNRFRAWTATSGNAAMAAFLSGGRDPAIARVERIAIRTRTDGGTPRELDVTGTTAAGERVSFRTDLAARYAKGIAGAAMRRSLVLTDGGVGGRLPSSQIERVGFAPFEDDDGNVHEHAITWAAEAGIVQGISDTRFAPNRAVTRAQMATFLVNTFEVPVAAPTGRFLDVDVQATHAANIEALVDIGIARGYDDDTFRPDQPVTRAQMATFLAGALALSGGATGSFLDVDGSGTHDAAIEAIAAAGVTSGCGSDRFCPSDPVQRGQLASFLRQAIVR